MWDKIKLSGFADEIDTNLDIQMNVLKKLGMSYVEMRGVDGKGLVEHTINEAKEIKARLTDNGIFLSSVGSPIGKIKITDEFAPHMELFKHTVEIAHVMDTPNIRMFSFFMPENESYAPYKNQVMDQLGQFVDYAKANKVILLHENEKDIYGDMADRCLEIMKEFYGDHFQAVFDFANFVQCKQDTMEAYEMLKPYISYVHIKDALWSDASVVPAGMGDGNVEKILRKLKDSGYQGFLSLEPHLSDFAGFSALEKNGDQKKKMSGEEAFTMAHDALVKILNTIS
ncbi:sugar phosphate isomerase/epimerase family protein [Clostridium boliviensis]|uniref:Sugar phosphate isomerase/epimerase family protein n=1 Tax=Clostridium boliviensis TaxID=318465 RepID=A0ABU4GR46_9CLOT|nr:sugar phosphate isomerase/epimerase family protein [Clostridium boliviensis]MDW2799455.1 sugar phosphate isomerase/epimerase family protein [Clostridium boliviensis]